VEVLWVCIKEGHFVDHLAGTRYFQYDGWVCEKEVLSTSGAPCALLPALHSLHTAIFKAQYDLPTSSPKCKARRSIPDLYQGPGMRASLRNRDQLGKALGKRRRTILGSL